MHAVAGERDQLGARQRTHQCMGEPGIMPTGHPVAIPRRELDLSREASPAADYLDSASAMALECLPESLIVISASAVGLELAQMFVRLGVRVTVLEALPSVVGLRHHASKRRGRCRRPGIRRSEHSDGAER